MATKTEWKPCQACGATVRHDNGYCIRDGRSPLRNAAHPSLGVGLRPDLPHSSMMLAADSRR